MFLDQGSIDEAVLFGVNPQTLSDAKIGTIILEP